MGGLESIKVAAGFVSTLLASTSLFSSNASIAVAVDVASMAARVLSTDGTTAFDFQLSRPTVKQDDGCDFNVPVTLEDGMSCSGGSVLRLSGAYLDASIAKALDCSVVYNGTDCILFQEIGLLIPGFYYHSPSTPLGELQAVYLPMRVINEADESTSIRIHDPSGVESYSKRVSFLKSVNVRYMRQRSGGFSLVEEKFEGTAAFCFQLLNESLNGVCQMVDDGV